MTRFLDDSFPSKPATDKYRDGWDRIFGSKREDPVGEVRPCDMCGTEEDVLLVDLGRNRRYFPPCDETHDRVDLSGTPCWCWEPDVRPHKDCPGCAGKGVYPEGRYTWQPKFPPRRHPDDKRYTTRCQACFDKVKADHER